MKKPKITYYYDALCGWCYGFSKVLTSIHQQFHSEIDFEVISGGLFLGSRTGNINVVAPYIKAGAYKNVTDRTGVKFGESFLKMLFSQNTVTLDSLNPAIAMAIVKESMPENSMAFAEILLRAFYHDGLDAIDYKGYAKYVNNIGFNESDFIRAMTDPRYKKKALLEFETYQNSGVGGFPSLLIEVDQNSTLLTEGYVDYPTLESRIKKFLPPSN